MNERFLDGLASNVLDVEDAALGVPPFFAEGDPTIIKLCEGHAAACEFLDAGGTIF